MNKKTKVALTLKSSINGQTAQYLYMARYAADGDIHRLWYSDIQGDDVTENIIHFEKDHMVINRHGAFKGSMRFEPGKETEFEYTALMTTGRLRILTTDYSLEEEENKVYLKVSYLIRDDSGAADIECSQEFSFSTL
ncbi:MAG: DUF1934 domain-containing protein [Lachnospiraceae bacterium]|nr:DUF1934 domain-containing protein [Lachnospiraceae bacterium]